MYAVCMQEANEAGAAGLIPLLRPAVEDSTKIKTTPRLNIAEHGSCHPDKDVRRKRRTEKNIF
jgi:hypothetical protein